MNKVKIFSNHIIPNLEDEVNEWTQKIKPEIIRIKYSTTMSSMVKHSVLIHYKTPTQVTPIISNGWKVKKCGSNLI